MIDLISPSQYYLDSACEEWILGEWKIRVCLLPSSRGTWLLRRRPQLLDASDP